MSPFEFVFALLSVIASLALVHLVSAFVALIRNASRVRFSPLYVMWMWVAFATTVGNWGAYWPFHDLAYWPSWLVLLNIALGIGQYVFCAFVAPEIPAEGVVDLAAIQMAERRRYIPAYLALIALAVVGNVAAALLSAYPDWLRDTVVSLISAVPALLGLLVARQWAQYAAAVPLVALSTWFMVAATVIGSS